MSAHHFAAIAKNTGRIAIALEAMLRDSQEAKNIDVSKVITEAMTALRQSNPAFEMAFSAMERQVLEVGDGNGPQDS